MRLRVEKESARQSVRCVVEHSALKSDMEASALLDIHCKWSVKYSDQMSTQLGPRVVSQMVRVFVTLTLARGLHPD